VMPVARALQVTFNGSAPCALCHLSQRAQETARDQLPHEAVPGGGVDKLLLVCESAAPVVVPAPDFAWPGVGNDAGPARTEAVPVPPPRV